MRMPYKSNNPTQPVRSLREARSNVREIKMVNSMKPSAMLSVLIIIASFVISSSGCSTEPAVQSIHPEDAIIHTVMFSLKTPVDSEESVKFLRDGKEILSSIPGVNGFEVRRQVSEKNEYQYGFSMVFSGKDAFDNYLAHPLHVSFVRDRWEKEVTAFLEADYKVLPIK